VAHTIRAAKQARTLDRVILSTDSPQIAKIGKQYGAEVPFLRPAELATDKAPVAPVLAHAIEWVEKDQHKRADIIVLLQATSPFRRADHIDAGVRMLLKSDAESVVGVCQARHSPYWMRIVQDGRLEPLLPAQPGSHPTRRQDLPMVYQINGAFYASRRSIIMEQGQVVGEKACPLVMEYEDSIDIDDSADLMLAKALVRSKTIPSRHD